jgi:hypothetical protein
LIETGSLKKEKEMMAFCRKTLNPQETINPIDKRKEN